MWRCSDGNNLMKAAKVAEAELVRYLHETKEVGDLSSQLKKLFIKYNKYMLSPVHCEKMFSATGLILGGKQGRMADENFEV